MKKPLASRVGILDVLDAGLVDLSVTLSNSANVEGVVVAVQTLEARSRDRLQLLHFFQTTVRFVGLM